MRRSALESPRNDPLFHRSRRENLHRRSHHCLYLDRGESLPASWLAVIRLFPVHGDLGDIAAFIVVFQMPVFQGILMDTLGDLHVEGTVFGNLP